MLKKTSSLAMSFEIALDNVHKELKFLSGVPPIQGLIRARKGNGYDDLTGSSFDDWEGRLSTIFYQAASTKGIYRKLGI